MRRRKEEKKKRIQEIISSILDLSWKTLTNIQTEMTKHHLKIRNSEEVVI
jgi:hypothetical protein